MRQEKIRVGIAGLGRSGWSIHAHLIEKLPEQYQVVAALDADAARRREAADRFACHTYTTYDDLLADDDVELMVVALPSHLHADGSIAALDAGKHVVCEKPMATSLSDADRMVAAAENAAEKTTIEGGKVLSIFQQRRYQPEFQKIRGLIDSGLLGRIVQIRIAAGGFSRRWDWQTLQKFGGGTLNNTGPHHLDHAMLLFGDSEPEVFCRLDRTLTLGDADDYVKILLKGENAPTIDIEISACAPYPYETWNIMGTNGGLSGTTTELRWKWVDWDAQEPRTLDTEPTPDRSYNRDQLHWQECTWRMEGGFDRHYLNYYRDLYETIRNGAPLMITAQSVRRVIWLQEEAHRLAPLEQKVY